MTLQLSDALVRTVYLFLDGGALLVIFAGFLYIGAGGCFGGLFVGAGGHFGGLFVLVSGTFPAPLVAFCSILLDAHQQIAWAFGSQSVAGRSSDVPG